MSNSLHSAGDYVLLWSTLTFMPNKIEEKTLELCQTIVDQPEMLAIRKRIDTFMADAGARGQYEIVMSKGNALHEKQHNGQTLEGTEIADFEKHRDDLLKNPTARDFLDAQEELHQMQHSIQKHVSKTFQLGRVPTGADLEEGSCGSGCGCNHNH
jgi:cell fate (sporulation/competence/biofilm development) regulator YlbF (YheA/YmcA/DUF963 family)